eukprot:2487317-Pyramimonas_sp.AAC.1
MGRMLMCAGESGVGINGAGWRRKTRICRPPYHTATLCCYGGAAHRGALSPRSSSNAALYP